MVKNYPNPFSEGVFDYPSSIALDIARDLDAKGDTQKIRLSESVRDRLLPTPYDPLTSVLLYVYQTVLRKDEDVVVEITEEGEGLDPHEKIHNLRDLIW